MSTLCQLFRIIVIKSNKYWPISYLNKIPYYVAIRLFVWINSGSSLIKAIYLRHGLIERNWIPGLSDIDITVIFKKCSDTDKEYLFIRSFWKRYELLRKVFPMLGEVSILNEELFKSWRKFTIRGYESKNWRLIYGNDEDIKVNNHKFGETSLEIDSINHCITNYLEFFLKEFFNTKYLSSLKILKLNRLLNKINRYTQKYSKQDRKSNEYIELTEENKIAYSCLKILDESIDHLLPILEKIDSKINIKLDCPEIRETLDPEWFGIDSGLFEGLTGLGSIETIYISYNETFVIVKNNIDYADFNQILRTLDRTFSNNSITPVILTSRLFNYLITCYNPFTYFELINSRSVPLGRDALPCLNEPKSYFLIKHILEQIPNIINFTTRNIFYYNNSNISEIYSLYVSMIIRSMYIIFYFEKEFIPTTHSIIISNIKKHYKEYDKVIKMLNDKKFEISHDNSNMREMYKFFVKISYDVHNYSSDCNTLDNIFD